MQCLITIRVIVVDMSISSNKKSRESLPDDRNLHSFRVPHQTSGTTSNTNTNTNTNVSSSRDLSPKRLDSPVESTETIQMNSIAASLKPSKSTPSSPKLKASVNSVNFKDRYWNTLYDNIDRSLDEFYTLCDEQRDVSRILHIQSYLQRYVAEFHKLSEKLELEKTYDHRNPIPVSWDVSFRSRRIASVDVSESKDSSDERGSQSENLKKAVLCAEAKPFIPSALVLDASKYSKQPPVLDLKKVSKSKKTIVVTNNFRKSQRNTEDPQLNDVEHEVALAYEQVWKEAEAWIDEEAAKEDREWSFMNSNNNTPRSISPPIIHEALHLDLSDSPRLDRKTGSNKKDHIVSRQSLSNVPISPQSSSSDRMTNSSLFTPFSTSSRLSLHEKLSSPNRKRISSPSDIKRKQDARLRIAESNRKVIVNNRKEKARKVSTRVQLVLSKEQERLLLEQTALENKLKDAEARHDEYIKQVRHKASNENAKVSEVNFINTLNAEEVQFQLQKKLEDVESRILQASQRRQAYLEDITTQRKKRNTKKSLQMSALRLQLESQKDERWKKLQLRLQNVQQRREERMLELQRRSSNCTSEQSNNTEVNIPVVDENILASKENMKDNSLKIKSKAKKQSKKSNHEDIDAIIASLRQETLIGLHTKLKQLLLKQFPTNQQITIDIQSLQTAFSLMSTNLKKRPVSNSRQKLIETFESPVLFQENCSNEDELALRQSLVSLVKLDDGDFRLHDLWSHVQESFFVSSDDKLIVQNQILLIQVLLSPSFGLLRSSESLVCVLSHPNRHKLLKHLLQMVVQFASEGLVVVSEEGFGLFAADLILVFLTQTIELLSVANVDLDEFLSEKQTLRVKSWQMWRLNIFEVLTLSMELLQAFMSETLQWYILTSGIVSKIVEVLRRLSTLLAKKDLFVLSLLANFTQDTATWLQLQSLVLSLLRCIGNSTLSSNERRPQRKLASILRSNEVMSTIASSCLSLIIDFVSWSTIKEEKTLQRELTDKSNGKSQFTWDVVRDVMFQVDTNTHPDSPSGFYMEHIMQAISNFFLTIVDVSQQVDDQLLHSLSTTHLSCLLISLGWFLRLNIHHMNQLSKSKSTTSPTTLSSCERNIASVLDIIYLCVNSTNTSIHSLVSSPYALICDHLLEFPLPSSLQLTSSLLGDLCSLPERYFNDDRYKHDLFPVLILMTLHCEQGMKSLKKLLSLSLISTYLAKLQRDKQEGDVISKKYLKRVNTKLPSDMWPIALEIFTNTGIDTGTTTN